MTRIAALWLPDSVGIVVLHVEGGFVTVPLVDLLDILFIEWVLYSITEPVKWQKSLYIFLSSQGIKL